MLKYFDNFVFVISASLIKIFFLAKYILLFVVLSICATSILIALLFYYVANNVTHEAVAAFIRRIFTHTGGGQGTRRTTTTTTTIATATTTINWFMNLGNLFRQSQPINIRRNRDESNDIGMLSSLFGTYFDAKKSTITWNMTDEVAVVGDEVVMTVQVRLSLSVFLHCPYFL